MTPPPPILLRREHPFTIAADRILHESLRGRPGAAAARCPLVRRVALRPMGVAEAFTLVELLVVLAIIGVLVSAIVLGGPKLIDRGRTHSTELLLTSVRDMIEEFKREQTQRPTLTAAQQIGSGGLSTRRYKSRYGLYPPDELEVFTHAGLPGGAPGSPTASKSLSLGGKSVVPAPVAGAKYPTMRFYTEGTGADATEHRDLAALVLAVEMFGDSSRAMLDSLSEGSRSPGIVDEEGKPRQFLDRNGNDLWTVNSDQPIRLIVDAWGVPLSYFAQREYDAKNPLVTLLASTNHPQWLEASTEMIQANGGQPIVVSYGRNGPGQLTREVLEADPTATLPGDWTKTGSDRRISNPLNLDNVYAEPSIKTRLETGVVP